MDREQLKAGLVALVERAEIKSTATSSAPPISDDDLNQWGQLFDGLSEPYRTPAVRLLREVKQHRKALGLCQITAK